MFRLPDPRTHGSGNPGATNVLRLGGAVPASMVLVFDVLKGTIPVWGSYFLGVEAFYLGMIAVCACLGHIFPIFFGFKGGKAVATAFGSMMPIGLDLAGLLISTWMMLVGATGYSSLAALVTVGLAPVFHLVYQTFVYHSCVYAEPFDHYPSQRQYHQALEESGN